MKKVKHIALELKGFLNPFPKLPLKLYKSIILISFIIYALLDKIFFDFTYWLMDLNWIGYKSKNHVAEVFSIQMFILGDLITSTIEEFLYRWGLVFSPKKSIVFIFSIFWVLLSFIFPYELYSRKETFVLFLAILVVGILCISILVYRNTIFIRDSWEIHKRGIFYVSILIFSISHLPNYYVTDIYKAILFTPILLIPYILSGYYFGLIRIHFGILYSIIVHIAFNVITRAVSVYLNI